MSPMCWLSQASAPRAMQKVFLSSPPTASSDPVSTGSRIGIGAYPRERRNGMTAPSTNRTTESSQGTWIGRLCTRNASAIAPRRTRASSSSKQIGSSLRLPLVITSTSGTGRSAAEATPGTRANSRWCSGVYGSTTPISGFPGATPSANPLPGRACRRTIGRAGDESWAASSSSTNASRRHASRSGAMTANGLSGRCFRWRRRSTASGERASQARW